MRQLNYIFGAFCVISLLLTTCVIGQTEKEHGKLSFGAGVGLFQPMGTWTDHLYAPGVKQFSRGFTAEFFAEYQLGCWGGVAITIGGAKLGTGEWTDYVRSQGDDITASAHMYHYSILFRPYLWYRQDHILKLDFGFGGFNPQGNESYMFFSYDYTFLQNKFAAVAGIEYCRFFSPTLALALRLGFIYADGGVAFADGLTQNTMGMPLTIGIRFYPRL
jgi:hypothetical protein